MPVAWSRRPVIGARDIRIGHALGRAAGCQTGRAGSRQLTMLREVFRVSKSRLDDNVQPEGPCGAAGKLIRFGFELVRCDDRREVAGSPTCSRARSSNQLTIRSSFKLIDNTLLTDLNKTGTMFFLCSVSGGRHVEDIRGRGCGTGVDHTFRRDDRHLGAVDSPTLTQPHPPGQHGRARPARQGLGIKTGAGENRDGGHQLPVPRGHIEPEASPLRGESAFAADSAPSSPVIALSP